MLGGCVIPYELGLLGHSDADVLIHAVMDALLGAAAMGDIGRIFPDNDDRFKNASGLHMLKEVKKMLKSASLAVSNIDGIIVAQEPRLAGFLPQMAKNIAEVLEISAGAVNVKATTEERMGFTGMGEGMAAHAVALLI